MTMAPRVLVCLAVLAVALASGIPAAQASKSVAPTPPRGWRSWNCFLENVNQTAIEKQIDAMAANLQGMYDRVGIDDGWQACGTGVNGTFHDKQGRPLVNTTRFPSMKDLTAYGKTRGIKLGMYMNNCGCSETGKEPWGGHPQQDIDAVVEWGFDGVKVDGCGPAHNITAWGDAVAHSAGADYLFVENCADNGAGPPFHWTAAQPADVEVCDHFQIYRVSPDISPQFESTMWNLNHVSLFNTNPHNPLSRPECWAYSDMLQVGNRLTVTESRTHFSAWCVSSNPLILGFDLTNDALMQQMLPIITNTAALDINAAWAGHPGRLVKNSSSTWRAYVSHGAPCNCCDDPEKKCEPWTAPEWQVWAKALPDGKQAVLVINLSKDKTQSVTVTTAEVGMAGAVTLAAVWPGTTVPTGAVQQFSVDVAPRDQFFVTLTPA